MPARSLTPPGGRASPLDQAAPRRLAPDRNRRPRPPLRLDHRLPIGWGKRLRYHTFSMRGKSWGW